MVKKQKLQIVSWALILGMTASSVLAPLQVQASNQEPEVSQEMAAQFIQELSVEDLDVSAANLIDGAGFDGRITLSGQGFTSDLAIEVVDEEGNPLASETLVTVTEVTETQVSATLPELAAGVYKLKLTTNDAEVVTEMAFEVETVTSEDEQNTESESESSDETESETEEQKKKKDSVSRAGIDLQGIFAEYYLMTGGGTGVSFGELKSQTIDFDINYNDMDPKLKMQTGADEHAGVKWSGQLKAPEDGNYTFYGYADNGIRMWITIDGEEQELFNFWNGDQWDQLQTSEEITLEEGQFYDYRVEYFEHVGGSHVTLSWSNDQSIPTKKVVPSSAFYLPTDYTGIYVSDIETDQATLEDSENFNGALTVKGSGFTNDTTFEVVKSTGTAVEDANVTVDNVVSDEEVQISVSRLSVGTYKIKATENGITVPSRAMFVVIPVADSGSTREEVPQQLWKRAGYVNLNGWWDFEFDQYGEGEANGWFKDDHKLGHQINVPFSWEASLSGVGNEDYQGEAWYEKEVLIDNEWDGKKVFLMFGAVDWKCKLWVNGELAGEHIGGYSAFEIDITEYINAGETNTFTLWVEDYGSYGDDSYPALIGKQGRNAPCGYTRTSGIWQTVGMEAREETFLGHARATTDIDTSTVTYDVDITSATEQDLTVEYEFTGMIYDIENDVDVANGSVIPKASQTIHVEAGDSTVTLDPIAVDGAMLWNYNDPNLYYGTLTLKSGDTVIDSVETYFGMRKVEQKYFDESLGVKYIYINDEPVYMSGLLDQGYWEGGVYTAPSEEALKYDILQMRLAGFNMIRKHLKVEDPLQYYWCDKLGMLLWQDMPHATNMVPNSTGAETLGRVYYEEGLEDMLKRNYNHPSMVAVMLFNETWGLGSAYANNGANRTLVAKDGKSTKTWIEDLYNKTKESNPNILVEDMSACNNDHVQPTDMNTYHMYPGDYAGTLGAVENYVNNAYVGSKTNFGFGESQDGDVFMNSEYGGVAAYAGDFDVSYCFKYMTDIQRRYVKQSGFVYTEPFDVEYERNGIMTYDRQMKEFGYEEVAYGGDMEIKDLTQEIYVGVVDDPIRYVKPGQKMNTDAMAVGWTNELPEKVTMKWRFDGTDVYGNNITTGESGSKALSMSPYRRSDFKIVYTVPAKACVGTLTVWLEDANGTKLAKNFTNVVVTDDSSTNTDYVQVNEDDSVTMKAKVADDRMDCLETGEAKDYSYTLPEDFDLASLRGMRIMAEVSSYKKQLGTDKFHSSFASAWAQTAEGRERASDVTVKVNGVAIDTVHLSDNPRDIRGTLTLNNLDAPSNQKTSAGDFGYLVNLNISDTQLSDIIANMGPDNELTVTYEVPGDAQQNGLRIYSSTYGRYAVNPTVILNPADQSEAGELASDKEVTTDSDNYSVEAELGVSEGYVVRNENGGGYFITSDGSRVQVINVKTNEVIADAAVAGDALVKTTLFDDQIRVYLNNDPEPVINVYDYSGFSGNVTLNAGVENAVVSPESYQTIAKEVGEAKEVELTVDFSDGDLDTQFDKLGNDLGATVSDGALEISGSRGDKLIFKDLHMSDGVYEADITINSLKENGGNTGFAFRSSNYQVGSDGLDGYYAGIGDGYIQLGRMSNNWKELAKVSVPKLTRGSTHRLRVAVYGSRIQVYLDQDKDPYISLTDNMYLEGGAAIRSFQSSATVDNIKIESKVDYRNDFAHGISEWISSGKWKNVNGTYQAEESGAFAYIDGDAKTDITVTAELKLTDKSSLPALLVRGSDKGETLEGYRVVLNAAESKVQFIKSKGQEESILAERLWKLDDKKAYKLSVEARNDHFKVYIDNDESAIFEVTDSEFESGVVGLYNGGTTAQFDNLVINHQYADGAILKDVVKELIEMIDAIGTVTLDNSSKGKIDEARKAYNALSADEKSLISNYKVLETAESVYKALSDGKIKEANEIAAAAVEKMINEIGTVAYTSESKAKIDAAKAAYDKLTAEQKKLVKNYSKIAAAESQYKKLGEAIVKVGKTYTVGTYKYKVTSLTKKTVTVTGVTKKSLKSITVKNTVKISGKTYKVTAIGKSAFKNCKKATKITIGKNVTSIGSKAFYKCKKVKKVVINSKKLKKVGSKAFKGIKSNAKILVPKKKVKAYKKLLKGKGQGKKVTIKKK